MFITLLIAVIIIVASFIINKMVKDLYPTTTELDATVGVIVANAINKTNDFKSYARLRTIKRTGTSHKNGKYFVS